jgi:hypothetical protein
MDKGRCRIVIYNEWNRKEYNTGLKRIEDAVTEMTDYIETKYFGRGCRR